MPRFVGRVKEYVSIDNYTHPKKMSVNNQKD
jgi:hypothetical protein